MLKKSLIFILMMMFSLTSTHAQVIDVDHSKIKADLDEMINDLSQHYIYFQEKNIDLNCLRSYYQKQIPKLRTEEDIVLFFEYILDEFYDSHLILNTNRQSSYRLYAPIYVKLEQGKFIVANVWQSQIENLDQNILGAELLKFNGLDVDQAIDQFPTHCQDKRVVIIREWVVNKIVAGRYNQPRILTLRLSNDQIIEYDLDKLKLKQSADLMTSWVKNEVGVIRINNTLGNNNLINAFDTALEKLKGTQGLIIDLRNTVDGGNSYVARGIMSRFITEPKPYQKHMTFEEYDGNPKVERSWVEYVMPRKEPYTQPVVVLVGRWTGSMGEGLAIGFEGMNRAEVVGTEMERLAGEMSGFSFKNQRFGYRLSTAKLFHINGSPREKYMPTNYVRQTTCEKDETLKFGLDLIQKRISAE